MAAKNTNNKKISNQPPATTNTNTVTRSAKSESAPDPAAPVEMKINQTKTANGSPNKATNASAAAYPVQNGHATINGVKNHTNSSGIKNHKVSIKEKNDVVDLIQGETLFDDPHHRAELTKLIRGYIRENRKKSLLDIIDDDVFDDEDNLEEAVEMMKNLIREKTNNNM